MATPHESITPPAITQAQADALLSSCGSDPAVRRLVLVLQSSTGVLMILERAGIFCASESLREVSALRAWASRELNHARRVGGGFATRSGHCPAAVRSLQAMLEQAARRLVLADREARRLWDGPELLDRAKKINAHLIDNPRGASDATRRRWKEWRDNNLPASRTE